MEQRTAEQARTDFAEILDRARVAGEPTLITRHGKPAAVVVSASWYQQTTATLSPAADVIRNLNAYEGGNIWQDIILTLPAYDEVRSDEIDTGANDRFVLIDGTVIRHDTRRGEWYEEAGQ